MPEEIIDPGEKISEVPPMPTIPPPEPPPIEREPVEVGDKIPPTPPKPIPQIPDVETPGNTFFLKNVSSHAFRFNYIDSVTKESKAFVLLPNSTSKAPVEIMGDMYLRNLRMKKLVIG